MNKLKVIFLSIVAACAYGVVHDQVTARLCIEYFTIAHPPIFHTTSPTLIALCWGIAATAGIGLILGAVLAAVSQPEGQPPYPIPRLARAILVLLVAMGISALIAGLAGFELSARGFVALPTAFAEMIPAEKHHRFMGVWFAHGASYFFGLTGGMVLCFRIWKENGRPFVMSVFPKTRGALIRAVCVTIAAAFALWVRFRAQ